MRIGVNYQVFNHPSMIFMVCNHQLFYAGIQLLLSWSRSTWLIHRSGISINCTTIFAKYRRLWPLDWIQHVFVGLSNKQIEVSTQSGIYYFVYHLIWKYSMASTQAAAYMLSHSFAPAYLKWD